MSAPSTTHPPTAAYPDATTDVVLTTSGLTKVFGETRAVDGVDIALHRGRIYGLIGRNGSGKTSLMRLITGLSHPTSGSVSLFGAASLTPAVLQRVGCLIEEPGLRDTMSARDNLRMHRIIRGVPSRDVETELLELVGLAHTGSKRTRDFSLGMRQRLGIAIALLTDPELLVLDEPVNGLDPEGVVEIRTLLRRLAAERDITILISSHNLPELFQTATDYILLDAGAVRHRLTLEELEQQTTHQLRIGCSDPTRLVQVVEQQLGTRDFTVMPDGELRLTALVDQPERVIRTLVAHDIYPTTFVTEADTLEGFFLTAVGGAAS